MNQMPTKKILVAFVGILLVAGLVWLACPSKKQRYLDDVNRAFLNSNRPCNFYGQILDQNNKPVAGVLVSCDLQNWASGSRGFGKEGLVGLELRNDKFERTTDSVGQFTVEGMKGLSLDLRLQSKEGYEFKPHDFGVTLRDIAPNKPSPIISTADKPYVFHAFKRGRSEPLVDAGFAFHDFIPDGRSYIIQLERKRIIEGTTGGDLKISMQRKSDGPLYDARYDDNYDWAVQIEGVEMQLLENKDPFMYLAPETGYVSSWSVLRKAGEKDFRYEVAPHFYLRRHDGSIYGRIVLDIHCRPGGQGTGGLLKHQSIYVYCRLNPRGSRNLQPTPGEGESLAP